MGFPPVDTCCGVINLKIANILMACIDAVRSVGIPIFFIGLYGYMVPVPLMPWQYMFTREPGRGVYVISIILAMMFCTKFCLDIIFVYGVVKERTNIVKAYTIVWILFFLLFMFTFYTNFEYYNNIGIFAEFVFIILNVYGVLLSYSYYKYLSSSQEV